MKISIYADIVIPEKELKMFYSSLSEHLSPLVKFDRETYELATTIIELEFMTYDGNCCITLELAELILRTLRYTFESCIFDHEECIIELH